MAPATSGSGEGIPAHQAKPVGLYDLFMRCVFPVMLAVGMGVSGLLWAHEGRLTVIETQRASGAKAHEAQHKALKETLDEVRADVKKLLGGKQK